jgi:hypothetical protein
LFLLAIHKTADVEKTFPEGAHIQPHRAGAVRLAKLMHTLANEHERHAAAVIALEVVQHAPARVQKRREVQIVGDNGRGSFTEVF